MIRKNFSESSLSFLPRTEFRSFSRCFLFPSEIFSESEQIFLSYLVPMRFFGDFAIFFKNFYIFCEIYGNWPDFSNGASIFWISLAKSSQQTIFLAS